MDNTDFDLVVVGAGSGGISSANLAKNLGKRVAIVENDKVGGECTWSGCVPSKALIRASQIAHDVNHLNEYGLQIDGSLQLNTKNVMSYVRSVIEKVYKEEKPEIFEKMGISVFLGNPKFIDNHRLKVGEQILTSKSFIIATGSSPFLPPIEGLHDAPYLTNKTIFDLEVLPDSMIILGAGPIGIEIASALNRLGVKITVLDMSDHILPREDQELVDILSDRLKAEGVKLLTSTKATSLSRQDDGIVFTVQNGKGQIEKIKGESTLIAVGRKPNTSGFDLVNAGVEYNPKGIIVNNMLQTTAKNIYACGDVVGPYQFSHMAEYQATIAVMNAVLPIPIKKKVDYSNVVWATFTDPELARAGFTEEEARERYGDKIRVYRHYYNRVDRGKTDNMEIGMSKFICSRKGNLLGIHILGEGASELLHEAQLAKSLKISFAQIQSVIHVYPTYSDVIKRPSGQLYADRIRENFFVKILQGLFSKKDVK
ncbi:MAG: NAD(P)/FAD-dependent oxidoreductase [Spirochaetota bacterium]|nr:NAD(P)/FAD-dependent oxidoreductase [Spirochaetota bacterium]